MIGIVIHSMLEFKKILESAFSQIPANISTDEELASWLRSISKGNLEKMQKEVDAINNQYKLRFSNMQKLYHGTTSKIANQIRKGGFLLTKGKRTIGFMNAEKTVNNLAVFLSRNKSMARAYGVNRDPYGGSDTEVLEVMADIHKILDMTKFGSHIPTNVRKTIIGALNWYSGRKTKQPNQSDIYWLVDQPEVVNAITENGYDAVEFNESRTTKKQLGVLDSGTTVAVFNPRLLHLINVPLKTLQDIVDYTQGKTTNT